MPDTNRHGGATAFESFTLPAPLHVPVMGDELSIMKLFNFGELVAETDVSVQVCADPRQQFHRHRHPGGKHSTIDRRRTGPHSRFGRVSRLGLRIRILPSFAHLCDEVNFRDNEVEQLFRVLQSVCVASDTKEYLACIRKDANIQRHMHIWRRKKEHRCDVHATDLEALTRARDVGKHGRGRRRYSVPHPPPKRRGQGDEQAHGGHREGRLVAALEPGHEVGALV